MCTTTFYFIFAILLSNYQSSVEHYWVFLCNSTNGSIGYSHMATIESIPLSNNILVAAWQESSGTEGSNDQHIAFSTSTTFGQTWSKQISVVNGNGYAVWGPVLHYDTHTNILWLFFAQSGAYNNRSTDRNYPGGSIIYQQSNDNGNTWNTPVEILSFYTFGNHSKVTTNPLIVLNMNNYKRWILPFWQQPVGSNPGGFAAVLISDDIGKTWNVYGHLNNTWLIENSLALIYDENVNTNNKTIYQVFRTKQGYIYGSYSSDSGITWNVASPIHSLLNPNSKVQMFTSKSTHYQILSYNPSQNERYPLDLAVSKDNTISWGNYSVIGNETKEQSYPTSIELNGKIYTVYSDSVHTGIRISITQSP